MGLLDGRVAVITASGSGMGRAAAVRMASEGAAVVVADIRGDAAAETVELCEAAGGSATSFTLDATEVTQIEGIAARCEGRLPGVPVVSLSGVGPTGRRDS